MSQQGMETGITGHHLPAAAGGGVAIENDGNVFLNALKHKRSLINPTDRLNPTILIKIQEGLKIAL